MPTRSRRSFSPRSTSCRCTRLRRAAARCGQTQTARSRAPAPPDNEKWSASSRWRMAWHRWCASSPTWGSSAKSTPTRAPQPLGPWFKWSARSQRPHLDPGRGGVCHQGLDIRLPRLPHGAVGRRAARSQRNRHPDRPVGVTVIGGGRGRGPRLLGGLPGARRPNNHSDCRSLGRPTRRWVGPACPINPVCALRAVRALGVPDIP